MNERRKQLTLLDDRQVDVGLTDAVHGDRPPVAECWARATEFVTELIGSLPEAIGWDTTHHLRGHLSIDGQQLVVIAPRDTSRDPIVLTAHDWGEIRTAPEDERLTLLDRRSIVDQNRLHAALAGIGPAPTTT